MQRSLLGEEVPREAVRALRDALRLGVVRARPSDTLGQVGEVAAHLADTADLFSVFYVLHFTCLNFVRLKISMLLKRFT